MEGSASAFIEEGREVGVEVKIDYRSKIVIVSRCGFGLSVSCPSIQIK
jgi:hypothetical protein